MTRTVMAGIKQPWQVIIFDDKLLRRVGIWHKTSLIEQSPAFHSRAAAENWAWNKAREMRIVKHGEAR